MSGFDIPHFVEKALRQSGWELFNRVLYDLCRDHSRHVHVEEVSAKLVLIGRAYAAALERRKRKDEPVDDFYLKRAVPAIMNSGIDAWIDDLAQMNGATMQNMKGILEVHTKVVGVFKRVTGVNHRSLASKYLHFHVPRLFFIYDSKADGAASTLAKTLPQKIARQRTVIQGSDTSFPPDPYYRRFFTRCLALVDQFKKDTGVRLDPRQLDNLLLGFSEEE